MLKAWLPSLLNNYNILQVWASCQVIKRWHLDTIDHGDSQSRLFTGYSGYPGNLLCLLLFCEMKLDFSEKNLARTNTSTSPSHLSLALLPLLLLMAALELSGLLFMFKKKNKKKLIFFSSVIDLTRLGNWTKTKPDSSPSFPQYCRNNTFLHPWRGINLHVYVTIYSNCQVYE